MFVRKYKLPLLNKTRTWRQMMISITNIRRNKKREKKESTFSARLTRVITTMNRVSSSFDASLDGSRSIASSCRRPLPAPRHLPSCDSRPKPPDEPRYERKSSISHRRLISAGRLRGAPASARVAVAPSRVIPSRKSHVRKAICRE